MENTKQKLENVLGYLTAMSFDQPQNSTLLETPLNELSEALEEFESMVSSSNVIETFESKMKAIDNKAIFGDSITDEEKDFYNENFDRMVENCNDESIHWKHHASKI